MSHQTKWTKPHPMFRSRRAKEVDVLLRGDLAIGSERGRPTVSPPDIQERHTVVGSIHRRVVAASEVDMLGREGRRPRR